MRLVKNICWKGCKWWSGILIADPDKWTIVAFGDVTVAPGKFYFLAFGIDAKFYKALCYCNFDELNCNLLCCLVGKVLELSL